MNVNVLWVIILIVLLLATFLMITLLEYFGKNLIVIEFIMVFCVILGFSIILFNVYNGEVVSTCYDTEFSNNIKIGDLVEVNGKKIEIDEVVYTDDESKVGIYNEKQVWKCFYDNDENVAYICKGKE